MVQVPQGTRSDAVKVREAVPSLFILEDDGERMKNVYEVFKGWHVTHAADVDVAKGLFKPPYTLIMLDHDLGGQTYVESAQPNTGYQFATWVSSKLHVRDRVVIHSYNKDGARRMARAIRDGNGIPVAIPFSVPLLKDLHKIYGPRK